jgi:4'-phosphopantetheinyl transferase EntD
VKDSESSISISHTGDFIAMIQDASSNPAIDIEIKNRKVHPILKRFTTEGELIKVGAVFPENPGILIWSAKECLFKMMDSEGVLFKDHLLLEKIVLQGSSFRAEWKIIHPKLQVSVFTKSFIFDELLISYVDHQIKISDEV